MEDHTKHRIEDYEEQVLAPIRNEYESVKCAIEIIESHRGIPTKELVQKRDKLAKKLHDRQTVDTGCIEFLDKSQCFKSFKQ